MFETLGIESFTPLQAAPWLGLALGAAFGALAEVSRFCLRRGLVPGPDRAPALALWAVAFAVAILGTQAAVAAGLVSFGGHRFHTGDLPVLALVAGGLLFGAGAVLARGCASRLTVLAATGNLRALTGIVVLALVALATQRGLLAPLRTGLAEVTVPLGGVVSLADLPGGGLVWAGLLALPAAVLAWRGGLGPRGLALGAGIGLLVPLGWLATGWLLADPFDALPVESLAFTGPAAQAAFYAAASTALTPGFGVGLVGGTLLGAFAAATLGGRARWQGFETTAQTGRSLAGAALMGLGGVLAGGCTVGAGLSGASTLGLAALVAFAAIVASIRVTGLLVEARSESFVAPRAASA